MLNSDTLQIIQSTAVKAEKPQVLDLPSDGRTAYVRQLEQAVNDCLNRPTDDRPRKVIMDLLMEPVPEETDIPGNFVSTGIHCQFKTRAKAPDRQSKVYDFGINEKGQLYFSERSPTNVNQTTFDALDLGLHVATQALTPDPGLAAAADAALPVQAPELLHDVLAELGTNERVCREVPE